MQVSLHLRATNADAKQAQMQVQRQFDALLDLIKNNNLHLESMHRTVTYNIDAVIVSDEIEERSD